MDLFDPQHIEQVKLVMPSHNRNGNDEQYQEGKEHFKTQTQIVLEHLERGEEVTGELMYQLHRILDTRPRIAAIKKSLAGTWKYIEERKIPGAHGAKAWRLVNRLNQKQ